MRAAQTSDPESIGGYRVVRVIGAGRLTRVCEARSQGGQRVAVKHLAVGSPLARERLEARFGHETATLARISHPNVVSLLDSGIDPEVGPYLVTPLLSGRTLRALAEATAETGATLCPEAALLLLVPLAAGVGALHEAGLLHRDLKPDNAMFTDEGAVMLIDLGLALDPEQTRNTSEGAIVGSVPYMSPEQIEGQPLTPASDVWSLGAIAYELMVGRRPFARERQSEEVAAILAAQPTPLTDLDRRPSPEFAALIERCLSKHPSERPADANALAAELGAHIDWTDSPERERPRLAGDPSGYDRLVAPTRVAGSARQAREAIARGETFAATRAIDRGLAYAPDDPQLHQLADAALTAAPSRHSVAAAPNRSRTWIAALAATALLTATAVWLATRSPSPSLSPLQSPPPSQSPLPLPSPSPSLSLSPKTALSPTAPTTPSPTPSPVANPTGSHIVELPDGGPPDGIQFQHGRLLIPVPH